jgi:hypothetical protein
MQKNINDCRFCFFFAPSKILLVFYLIIIFVDIKIMAVFILQLLYFYQYKKSYIIFASFFKQC